MKLFLIIVLSFLAAWIISCIYEKVSNKNICKKLKLINRYLIKLKEKEIAVMYNGKILFVTVKSAIEDPVYKKLFYINDELVLTAYELNHGSTNSVQLEYSEIRYDREINKIIKLTLKKLKKSYYNKHLKINYDYELY